MPAPANRLMPRSDRGPLRVAFVITSMPIGGAETLLVQLIRGLDRQRFLPTLFCLKEPGPLGESIRDEIDLHSHLISGKYDVRVLGRLTSLFRRLGIDAVVTVGAGDKMFWGRLAARRARVPVVISAIHSTGWPDGIGRLNRMLTRITDAFVAVAEGHRRHLIDVERFPSSKVELIPNGIDVERFRFNPEARRLGRERWQIPDQTPCVGLVAALRPEKDHETFVSVAEQVCRAIPDCRFLLVGDGPQRGVIEAALDRTGMRDRFVLAGSRHDIPECLSVMDLFLLTSRMEASPVSILEAQAVGLPVVATDVGSISESVIPEITGALAGAGDVAGLAAAVIRLLQSHEAAQAMGSRGRDQVVCRGSVQAMISGYEGLIESIYDSKVLDRVESSENWARVSAEKPLSGELPLTP